MKHNFRNPMGFYCLPPNTLKRAMGQMPNKELPSPYEIELQQDLLEEFNIPRGPKQNGNECLEVPWLPPLLGQNIQEHFELMADEYLEAVMPGLDYLTSSAPCNVPDGSLYKRTAQAGWTRYEPNAHGGFDVSYPDHPQESGFVFDCETFVQGSPLSMPIIATAINGTASYLWLSPQLTDIAEAISIVADLKQSVADWFMQLVALADPSFRKLLSMGVTSCPQSLTTREHITESQTPAISIKLYLELMQAISKNKLIARMLSADYTEFYCFDYATAPMPSVGRGKVIVAHNTAFDCCRTEERFEITTTPVNFWYCTMSMHQLTNGLDSSKRWAIASRKKAEKEQLIAKEQLAILKTLHATRVAGKMAIEAMCEETINSNESIYKQFSPESLAEALSNGSSLKKLMLAKANAAIAEVQVDVNIAEAKANKRFKAPRWMQYGDAKGLIDAYNFHCGKQYGKVEQATKATRNLFVVANCLTEFAPNMDELLEYAMNDVVYTHRLFNELYPKYREAAPSKVMLASHTLLASSVMPVASDWFDWYLKVDTAVATIDVEVAETFHRLAKEYHTEWQDGKLDPSADPWLKHLDWAPGGTDADTGQKIAKWYIACNGGKDLTPRKVTSMYLLKMQWLGNPLYKSAKQGIGYDCPEKKCFVKLPHKTGSGGNVGSVLTSYYLGQVENGILSSVKPEAIRIMKCMEQKSYWAGYSSRIRESAVKLTTNPINGAPTVICAPKVVPHNTITLRTGENLWLTTAAHIFPKPGAEIKAKASCLQGCYGIGYDFDGQELSQLGAGGDSFIGISGATPLGCRLLSGSKADKTDPHWAVALKAGIGRDAAKQSVYSMCYGGGVGSVSSTIRNWHPNYPEDVAKEFAKSTIASFKGVMPRGSGMYMGGEASECFNWMLSLLHKETPYTPFFDTRMPPANWPENSGDDGAPSQLNWFVQCGGSSQLNAVLLGNWWMAKRLRVFYFLCCTMHDELYNNVAIEDAELMAYGMQVVHLWSWCLLHYKLGLADLPVNRAFVSGISLDKVWRKEPSSYVGTPTHDNIPPGQSIDMQWLHDHGYDEIFKQRWEAWNGTEPTDYRTQQDVKALAPSPC